MNPPERATAETPVGRRVEAWNEWDPLEEIVVGRVGGACFSPTGPGYRAEIRDHIVYELFHADPCMAWTAAPKPSDVTSSCRKA